MGRRITRKQLKEDEFVTIMDLIIRWFSNNWRPFAAGLGAVCLVSLVWWAANTWTTTRTDDASYDLREAVAAFTEAQAAGAEGDMEGARAKLQEVVGSYGRSDQADMARLYLARLDTSAGETDTARAELVTLVERHRGDIIGRLAALDLVHIRVASGQGAEVAQELEAMVAGRDTRLPRDVALFELAEVFISEQKPEQAVEYLQKLVEEFPESPYVANARQRLAELGQG